jgi:hypothetical protein
MRGHFTLYSPTKKTILVKQNKQAKIMLFKRLFKRKEQKKGSKQEKEPKQKKRSDTYHGFIYMGLAIALQPLLLLGLLAIVVFGGKIISTPWWIFLITFVVVICGCTFIVYGIKKQFRELRQTVKDMNLSDRNYEINVMGGALSMRIEQNPTRLLEAPPEGSVIDAVTIEADTLQKDKAKAY